MKAHTVCCPIYAPHLFPQLQKPPKTHRASRKKSTAKPPLRLRPNKKPSLVDTTFPLCFNPSVMSRICQICQKTYKKGNLVPRGVGKRVTRRTTRHQQPNLRTKRVEIDGRPVRLTLCAACLKKLKKDPDYIKKAEI